MELATRWGTLVIDVTWSPKSVEDREEVGNRHVFDPEISESSPIVRGTWVTVSHVISLIVDGWTWADILRSHPELTEDDIRACLVYQIESENA